jgi:two-component system, chemotaxis family, response regulator Rcp1
MTESPPLRPPRPPRGMSACPRPGTTPVQVLLVEDSPDDADLMIEALKEGTLDLRVCLVEDGEEAICFLRREGPDPPPRPDLILLDLHLPCKNGYEVLDEIKNDPDLRLIPVVVMTSAPSEQVFLAAYDLHANCCVAKPVDQDEYLLTVQKIENFWINVARRARRP